MEFFPLEWICVDLINDSILFEVKLAIVQKTTPCGVVL